MSNDSDQQARGRGEPGGLTLEIGNAASFRDPARLA